MEHALGEAGSDVLAGIVGILVVALFLHLSARFLTERPRFLQAVLTAVLGGFLAVLVLFLLPNVLGFILAIVVWMAAAAAIYRIGWFRALLLGLLAYLLFILVRWLLLLLLGAIGA